CLLPASGWIRPGSASSAGNPPEPKAAGRLDEILRRVAEGSVRSRRRMARGCEGKLELDN
ncbi:TPA: hypothetical protein ACXM9F_002691, partial [Burkholderia cenocepacia]